MRATSHIEITADGKREIIKLPPAAATINRELAILRIAFNRALEAQQLARIHIPVIHLLSERSAVREGFIEPADFERLHDALPADLRDAIRFLYLTSWRAGAMRKLRWADCELEKSARAIIGGRIRLRAANAKNGRAQSLPLYGDLLEIIKRASSKRDLACPFVFHRDGAPIGDFRKSWASACKRAGLSARLLVHDLRRSGVRNLIRAGVPEVVAMSISGHRTHAIFDRYNIVSEKDAAAAISALSSYHRERAKEPAKIGVYPTLSA